VYLTREDMKKLMSLFGETDH
jgi:phosphate starvation-inducible protein PhoH